MHAYMHTYVRAYPPTPTALKAMGHDVRVVKGWDRSVFGKGQIIVKADNGTLWAASDFRADGCAMGY